MDSDREFDPTLPVRTRDGREARILAHDVRLWSSADSVVALVRDENGQEDRLVTYFRNGKYLHGSYPEHEYDLVNVLPKASLWVQVYILNGCVHSAAWFSEQSADIHAQENADALWLWAGRVEIEIDPRRASEYPINLLDQIPELRKNMAPK